MVFKSTKLFGPFLIVYYILKNQPGSCLGCLGGDDAPVNIATLSVYSEKTCRVSKKIAEYCTSMSINLLTRDVRFIVL